jgi:S1-C subfamily serine protease
MMKEKYRTIMSTIFFVLLLAGIGALSYLYIDVRAKVSTHESDLQQTAKTFSIRKSEVDNSLQRLGAIDSNLALKASGLTVQLQNKELALKNGQKDLSLQIEKQNVEIDANGDRIGELSKNTDERDAVLDGKVSELSSELQQNGKQLQEVHAALVELNSQDLEQLSVLSRQIEENVQLIDEKIAEVFLNAPKVYESTSASVVQVIQRFSGSGAGFIFGDESEYIVTANHVVEKRFDAVIIFANNELIEAIVVARLPEEDIAILKLARPFRDAEPLQIADSSTLKEGQPVVLIGHPYNLTGSVSVGVISGLDRNFRNRFDDGFCRECTALTQVDAAVNPGNSGGPALNARGKVIGVVSFRIVEAERINFVIPSNTVQRLFESIKK